ncbi:MAG TPA: hypothetical protein PKY77_10750 [Phycisphaerae bacterium]|nr:hypothetical protein [Phycisphaerae bacterium]HRY70058.1 hypothetical protein [Phycisphaerae bacterium]HSA27334.1 hypothetical protein [Phycisphaerae bacterium]
MKRTDDEKAALVSHLKELHVPTIRSCLEQLARQAEHPSTRTVCRTGTPGGSLSGELFAFPGVY